MDDGAAHAVDEADGILAEAHEAARAAGRGDADIACAMLNGHGAVEVADESADVMMILVARIGFIDVAVDGEVAERGLAPPVISGVGERGHVLCVERTCGGAVADGERVALPVKGAGEVMVAAACHAADADVRTELHGLAIEDALGVKGQQVAEQVPARSGLDGVLVGGRLLEMGRVAGEGDDDMNNVFPAGDRDRCRFGVSVFAGPHHIVAAVLDDHILDEVVVRSGGSKGERRGRFGFKEFVAVA